MGEARVTLTGTIAYQRLLRPLSYYGTIARCVVRLRGLCKKRMTLFYPLSTSPQTETRSEDHSSNADGPLSLLVVPVMLLIRVVWHQCVRIKQQQDVNGDGHHH